MPKPDRRTMTEAERETAEQIAVILRESGLSIRLRMSLLAGMLTAETAELAWLEPDALPDAKEFLNELPKVAIKQAERFTQMMQSARQPRGQNTLFN